MPDLRIPLGNDIFAVRTAILCVHEGCLLVQRDSRFPDFAFVPGGALLVGEESIAGAAREWREEMGTAAGELRLLGVVENFFAQGPRRWHEIAFYFQMQPPELLPAEGSSALDHSQVTNHWIPLHDVPHTKILPAVVEELLAVPAGEVRHIVNRETVFDNAPCDLRFPVNETMFAVRVGIIFVQEGQLLVIAGDHFDFKYSPGGAVNLGEEAAEAAAREWREETLSEAGPLRLVGILENFFELKGKRWHEIGFYYEMSGAGQPLAVTHLADQPSERLEWVPLDQLAAARVYPQTLARFLHVPAGEIRHLVQHG